MLNQPTPTRLWFRSSSISRPASQEPTPSPEPAPALPRSTTIRPAFRPPSPAQPSAAATPSPADKKPTVPVNAATSLVPTSPVKTTSPENPMVSNTTANVSPAKRAPAATSVTSSPTQKPASSVTKDQIQSPKMMDKPKGWLFGGGNKYSSDYEDAGMRIITITGDNKGAILEINQSTHRKNGSQGSPHRLENSSSREAGDGKMKSKSNSSKRMPMNVFINSNVQGINNSIVYNSSCAYHDPGVHLALYTKPSVGGFHVEERTNGNNN